jgi:hypothetical protein
MDQSARLAIPSCGPKFSSIAGLLTAFVLGGSIVFAGAYHFYGHLVPPSAQRVSVVHPGLTLGHLLELPPDELAKVDIAEMNLLCAKGLPGVPDFDIAGSLAILDQWSDHVDSETRRNWHRFKDNPEDYHNSEAEFRMGMLITVLQQDYGVQYDPDLIPFAKPNQHGPEIDRAFLTNPGNVFLVELLNGHRAGSCASMPVLYTAVARRLGYPVKLSRAKDHLFVRWDRGNGASYLDVEGASMGFSTHTDDFYKKWPQPISDEEIKSGQYLNSFTPSQELSVFMATRGGALLYHHKIAEALTAYAEAVRLWPECRELHARLADVAQQIAPEEIRSTPIVIDPALLHDPRHMDALSEIQMLNQLNGR